MTASEPRVAPARPVAVLLADVGDSNQPHERRQPKQIQAAVARLDNALEKLVSVHHGVRSTRLSATSWFVAAFADAGDAIACAIELQRESLAGAQLRVAITAGEVSPTGSGSYTGPVVNRAARLCDLANGGQTLLSTTVEQAVADRLPPDAWLVDLGSYRLHGDRHPERVAQLCHRDLANDFPPLRTRKAAGERYLPTSLTSFVGRETELKDLRQLVADNRLVTLTGTGGVGKSRLALQLAGELVDEFAAGVWWVDLASLTAPEMVAVRVVHTLGLADQPDHPAVDTLIGYLGDSQTLLVLDNCEHLLEGCSPLVATLLAGCPQLTIVATSRESIEVAGEVIWMTQPLSATDDAVELFTHRARLARSDFIGTGDDAVLVAEICQRLDGVPLAIELAATRVRALSLAQIADGLGKRLDLLVGGARTLIPRHQTLRASEDWSHSLLGAAERVVFRRLAVFRGGFDLDAVHAVVGKSELKLPEIVNILAQLVDRSLVIADSSPDAARYRMLETVRQYAGERLEEAGETDAALTRHRDHYLARFGISGSAGYRWHIDEAEIEIDNLRAAFTWSQHRGEIELASRLASSLLPLWIHSRVETGLAWFNAILTDSGDVVDIAHARSLADKTILQALAGDYGHCDQADKAVAIARDLDDPALLAWALAACGFTCAYDPGISLPYLREAVDLSRALADDWRLSQIFGVQAFSAFIAGDLATMRKAAGKGRDLAEKVGDWSVRRLCGLCLGLAHLFRGDLVKAVAQAGEVAVESEAAQDPLFTAQALTLLGIALAGQGDTGGARATAEAAIEAAVDLIPFHRGFCVGGLMDALLAAGDVSAAQATGEVLRKVCALPQLLAVTGDPLARAALAAGDVATARRSIDEAFAVAPGVHRMTLLQTRIRVAIAEGQVEHAERDIHDALALAKKAEAYALVPEVIECLAMLTAEAGNPASYRTAARLFGSAAGIRDRTGAVRFKIYDADHAAAVRVLRDAMGRQDFDSQWAQGAALSTADAVAQARQGRSERIRPPSGWTALTPAERDVVQLVGEGLRNKDIAVRLFISARTVQAHLTHIYAKLGLSSRVQLVQEAAQHLPR